MRWYGDSLNSHPFISIPHPHTNTHLHIHTYTHTHLHIHTYTYIHIHTKANHLPQHGGQRHGAVALGSEHAQRQVSQQHGHLRGRCRVRDCGLRRGSPPRGGAAMCAHFKLLSGSVSNRRVHGNLESRVLALSQQHLPGFPEPDCVQERQSVPCWPVRGARSHHDLEPRVSELPRGPD